MEIQFNQLASNEFPDIINFIQAHKWQYHNNEVKKYPLNYFLGRESVTFWIVSQNQKIGFIRIFRLHDVDDIAPRFDLRVTEEYRGKGVGTQAVQFLTKFVFETYPHVRRIKVCARSDNGAMQHVLEKCGYRKEGCSIKAWKVNDHEFMDSISMAILRDEWKH